MLDPSWQKDGDFTRLFLTIQVVYNLVSAFSHKCPSLVREECSLLLVAGMKIQVMKRPEEGLKLDFLREGEWFHEVVPDAEGIEFSLQAVHASLVVRRTEKAVIIEGMVETVVDTACSRCLDETHLPIRTSFRYTYLPADEMVLHDRELNAEDIEFSYFEGEMIDLDPLIYEQVVLQIPIKTLCCEDCRGLCPRCGTNLNISGCDCDSLRGDDRFAILKNYRKQQK